MRLQDVVHRPTTGEVVMPALVGAAAAVTAAELTAAVDGVEAIVASIKGVPIHEKIDQLNSDISHVHNLQDGLAEFHVPERFINGANHTLVGVIHDRQQQIAVESGQIPSGPDASNIPKNALDVGLAALAFAFVAVRTATTLSPTFRKNSRL